MAAVEHVGLVSRTVNSEHVKHLACTKGIAHLGGFSEPALGGLGELPKLLSVRDMCLGMKGPSVSLANEAW